jgi:hypothetical protein
LLNEDEDHPNDVIVKCGATTARGDTFQGYLTPLLQGMHPHGLSPHIFVAGSIGLCLGVLDAVQQATVLPRWRTQVEAAFGQPLRELFPVTLTVPDGILPPAVPSQWSLPGLMYLANWRPQVVPAT